MSEAVFMLVIYLGGGAALISGPYEPKDCDVQAEMVVKSGGYKRLSMPMGRTRANGDVECLRDSTFVPESNVILTPTVCRGVECVQVPAR